MVGDPGLELVTPAVVKPVVQRTPDLLADPLAVVLVVVDEAAQPVAELLDLALGSAAPGVPGQSLGRHRRKRAGRHVGRHLWIRLRGVVEDPLLLLRVLAQSLGLTPRLLDRRRPLLHQAADRPIALLCLLDLLGQVDGLVPERIGRLALPAARVGQQPQVGRLPADPVRGDDQALPVVVHGARLAADRLVGAQGRPAHRASSCRVQTPWLSISS